MSKLRPQAPPAREQLDISETGLETLLHASRVHIDVIIPRTTVAAKMRLLSRKEQLEVDVGARSALASVGLPIEAATFGGPSVSNAWFFERGIRILQVAVRDPKDVHLQLATIGEWRECDDDQIGALLLEYQELAARLDPLANRDELTEEEIDDLLDAAKKKDVERLTAFGSPKLARFTTTLVERLAS